MQIVIFTYNRQRKLKALLRHLKGYDVIVIDDGSDWSLDRSKRPTGCQYFRTPHDGKEGMWRNLLIAHELALASEHEYFLFIADDVKPDMTILETLTKQSWENRLFTISPTNVGRYQEWGKFRTGQDDFKIGKYKFTETGFVDLGMFTNRYTLESIRVDQIPEGWFNREGKSSGVGHMMSRKLREKRVCMLTTKPSISKHGTHPSVMHRDHRKETPLKSI